MTYSLNSLSNTLTAKIIEYLDSKTKRELSMVDRRTRAVVLETVRSIRVFPAKYFPHRTHSSDIPQDILVRVICRYPTLERIIFGPPKHIYGCHEFTSQEVPYLKSLISYLESSPEKHPLSSVKKIEFREITKDSFEGFGKKKAKELNNHFLSAISHKDLEKVAIRADNISSILTGAEIQPVLTNSPNLKTFEFNGFQSDQIVTISFASQPELTKVK
ncbi:MAG: hypothetical protein VX777_04610, partial [Chlamydiota bacterium]|nr:hypothetical protein [Chlamydiota bacterium]